nr:MAG TPA: hypothetical protein [Caudoviricetes sp.]
MNCGVYIIAARERYIFCKCKSPFFKFRKEASRG